MGTDYLYARPSFLEGVARILDFADALNIYNTSPGEEEADARALYEDWQAVRADLRAAMTTFEAEVASLQDSQQPASADAPASSS